MTTPRPTTSVVRPPRGQGNSGAAQRFLATLARQLLLYIAALHALLLVFSWRIFIETPWLFVAVEALLLASLAGGWHLVRRALAPVRTARQFQELLQDQH